MIRNNKSLYSFFCCLILFYSVFFHLAHASLLIRSDLKRGHSGVDQIKKIDHVEISKEDHYMLQDENDLSEQKTVVSRWKLKYLFENIPLIVLAVFGMIMNMSGVLLPKTNYSFMSYISCYYFILFVSILLDCYNYNSISSQLNLCVGVWMLGFIVSILTYFFESVQHIIKGTTLASTVILIWIQIQSNIYIIEQLKWYFIGYLSIVLMVLLLSTLFPFFIMTFVTSTAGTILLIFHLMVFFKDITPFQETEKEDPSNHLKITTNTYGFMVGAIVMFAIGFSLQLILFNLKHKSKREQVTKQ